MNEKPLIDIVWRADMFAAREIPPRAWMVEGVIPESSIGMLYAWRGSGKTLVSLDLALAIARGGEWIGYKVPEPRSVLYIDGELPLPDLRQRLVMQSGPAGAPENLFILSSEDLAADHRGLNIAKKEDQDAITNLLTELASKLGNQIGLVVIDNWSALVDGLEENSNDLGVVKRWLIMLRHFETSVLIVHHAGNSGRQRGGTGKEDILDYSLKLTGENGPERVEWVKNRTGVPDPKAFGVRLEKYGDKYLRVVKVHGRRETVVQRTDIVLEWLKTNGPATSAEVAEALDLHRMKVARVLEEARESDLVVKIGGNRWKSV